MSWDLKGKEISGYCLLVHSRDICDKFTET